MNYAKRDYRKTLDLNKPGWEFVVTVVFAAMIAVAVFSSI